MAWLTAGPISCKGRIVRGRIQSNRFSGHSPNDACRLILRDCRPTRLTQCLHSQGPVTSHPGQQHGHPSAVMDFQEGLE